MKFKKGDTVIISAEYLSHFGDIEKIVEVVEVKDGVAFINKECTIGYWATTGAGFLGKEDEEPMIRKLTKLDKALK